MINKETQYSLQNIENSYTKEHSIKGFVKLEVHIEGHGSVWFNCTRQEYEKKLFEFSDKKDLEAKANKLSQEYKKKKLW